MGCFTLLPGSKLTGSGQKGGQQPGMADGGDLCTEQGTWSLSTKNLTARRAPTDWCQQYVSCFCCSLSISSGWAWFPDSINHSVLQTFNLYILKYTHTHTQKKCAGVGNDRFVCLEEAPDSDVFQETALDLYSLGVRRCEQLFLLSRWFAEPAWKCHLFL